MDFATDEGRRFCALQLEAELHVTLRQQRTGTIIDVSVRGLDAPADKGLPEFMGAAFTRAIAELGSITPPEGLTLRWACKLRDLAHSCKRWPQDIGPTLHAALDKALTIELSKRKHAAAPSGTETAQVGLELAGAGLDLALKKLRVASELITALRTDLLAILKGDRPLTPTTIDLLAQWDKLKGK